MRILAIFLTLLSILWGAVTLPTESMRLKHQPTLSAVKKKQAIQETKLKTAIDDYQSLVRHDGCHQDFHRELTTLHMAHYAQHQINKNPIQQDETLSLAIEAADKHLNCQPKDGNGWLNKALIHIQQAGFNDDAIHAYRQSAAVSPREAWLAAKRSFFAIRFFPLFDQSTRAIAIQDIEVLQSASSNRRRKLRKTFGVESLNALSANMKRSANITSSSDNL